MLPELSPASVAAVPLMVAVMTPLVSPLMMLRLATLAAPVTVAA